MNPQLDSEHAFPKLLKFGAVLASLPIVGTVGLMWIEGWSVLDSLYMSVITLSTVGFEEVHPLSNNGRIFIIIYLVAGLGGFLYALVQVGEMIVRTELRGWLGRRRMDRTIRSMDNHYIVCGVGRVGMRICRFLEDRNLPFVAIDRDPQIIDECQRNGWQIISGDATDDQSLSSAGIERAKGLCTVLSTDADNVYVVLSARLLAKKIQIISRGSDDKSVRKLKRAGANHVVSLYATGASKMAQMMANEKLEDFIEIFADRSGELDLVELKMESGGKYVGQRLVDTNFTSRGIMIVAIRRSEGELQIPPDAQYEISQGDSLIAVGKAQPISELTNLI